jgi:transposase InsO family protein
MDQRLAFITACLNRRETIVEVCERFGISEKTGHKWLDRFRSGGLDGLRDRSHAPHILPHRMAPEVAERIVALRRRYPRYGPEKLRDWLEQHEPGQRWPAVSSIGALLKRAALVRPRRRRARTVALAASQTPAHAPNTVWTADFKGEFRLTTGPYCYPLTVLDLHSRYLLRCTALATTAVGPTRAVFVRLFQAYGLPAVLRSDNGVPFAQPNAIGRLGALAFWWIRLGIRPEHIRPATPSENGAHERFHRTLKADATQPASASFRAQQQRFDAFRAEYNAERPHASLPGHQPPHSLYTPSPRPYPRRLPALCYPDATTIRLVDSSGVITWRTQPYFLSTNLAGEYVALTETPSDLLTVTYASLALGEIDPHSNRFIAQPRWVEPSTSAP